MTVAADTLAALHRRGYTVSRAGPDLRLSGPAPLTDAALRASVLTHKVDILALLDAAGRPSAAVTAPADPRPDLADDAALWARLLAQAWARDGADRCGVFGSLLGMRCLGVQLVRRPNTLRLGARPAPPGDPPRWVTPEQYATERERWLDPHREAVISLLGAAAATHVGLSSPLPVPDGHGI